MVSRTRLIVAGIAALACAGAAFAQVTPPAGEGAPPEVPADANTRGVRVLRPEAPPVPDRVTPTPAPTPPAPTPTPLIKLCERPFTASDVRWDGVSRLDRELSRKLKQNKRVIVDLAQPYPERAAAPAGLTRWLSEVKRSGGSVTVKQYCKAARGGLGSWLAELAESLGGGSTYRPARRYDVVLHTDALDKVVTQVEFVPRTTAS